MRIQVKLTLIWAMVAVLALATAAKAADQPEIRTPKAAGHAADQRPVNLRRSSGLAILVQDSGHRRPAHAVFGRWSARRTPGRFRDRPDHRLAEAARRTRRHLAGQERLKGANEKKFKIVVGETIALTPPLGWNSWNCWGSKVTADKVLQSARGMAKSGLIDHGWTYINIDDAWQSNKRGGPFNAIQGNEKFPDMKGLCDEIHNMGLKVGIYSTPWVTSYANHMGGSAENPEGTWEKPTIAKKGKREQKNSSLGDRQVLLRRKRRQAMGRLGYRLPEIRLESQRSARNRRNVQGAAQQRPGRCPEPVEQHAV